MIVIVYGSAADPTTSDPGDVDVAYAGVHRRDAEDIVARWADQNGRQGLPIDWHQVRQYDTRTVHLPAPCGIEGTYRILAGDVEVKWKPEWGIASVVRAYANTPRQLHTELLRKDAFWRLAIIKSGSTNDDRDYVEGLTALRSAVRKSPAARDLIAREWPLIGRLLDQDPQPAPQTLRFLQQCSPWAGCGEVSVVLQPARAPRLEYGPRADVTEEMLWPGK